jgi:hypothetical protein
MRLRAHALAVMRELAAFWPRLVGVLAELDRLRFPFFEGVELEVDPADLAAVARRLTALGYQVETVRRDGRLALEADLLEPLVIWAANGKGPAVTLPELEAAVRRLYATPGGKYLWYRLSLAGTAGQKAGHGRAWPLWPRGQRPRAPKRCDDASGRGS